MDDEKLALARLVRAIRAALPDAVIAEFTKVSDALAALEKTKRVDVFFTDIEMPKMSGLLLAKNVKELSPDTHVIFVTGYSQYAVEAFAMNASGYLLKSVTPEAIRRQIEYLKKPIRPLNEKRLQVQCFGNFEIFANGSPLEMKREKSKELFAYLVDRRGAAVSGGELCAVLWENKANTASTASYHRSVYAQLLSALRRAGVEDVLVKGRNSYAIDTGSIECDFYQFLQKDPIAINSYRGEYMNQYSWAEMTLAQLY